MASLPSQASGTNGAPEERLLSCTIVVGRPNALVAEIHNRMVVILPGGLSIYASRIVIARLKAHPLGDASLANTDVQAKPGGKETAILAKEQLLITVTTEDAKNSQTTGE